MKSRIVVITLFAVIFLSCSKKNEVESSDVVSSKVVNKDVEKYRNSDGEISFSTVPKEVEVQVERKKIEPIIYVNKNFDDSIYDNEVILNFCLMNSNDISFCLYHNIRKIKDYDDSKKEKPEYFSSSNPFYTYSYQDLFATWVYETGLITELITTSSEWSTKRGVKVGDPISKVVEAYGEDSNILVYDYETEKFSFASKKEKPMFGLYTSNEGCSLNGSNMIDEENMCITFYAENGLISKIKVYIGHQKLRIKDFLDLDLYTKYTFDLADYQPHVDGFANIYVCKNDLKSCIVKLYYYSSMYKIQYFFTINNDYLDGYCEKILYKEPYTTEDAEILKLEEFSGKRQSISSSSKLTQKSIDLIYFLLSEIN